MRKTAAVFFLAISFSVHALSIEMLDVTGGFLWIGNGERPDETTGAPSPITQAPGIHMRVRLSPLLAFEPGLFFGSLNYGFAGGPRPRPVQIEHREMSVLNIIAEMNMLFLIPLDSSVSVSPGLSLAGVFHIPVTPAPGEEDQSEEMLAYFMGAGRWFLPGVFARLDWQFSPRFGFVAKPGVRLPVFHFWDGEGLPFYDQMIVYFDIGISYKL